ncbi:helix-turn-helix domain-containing protein [Pelagicoccus mobilis]|uniref:Helix-turn-helix domain-containing protein n=1 Tax=Pelagicoccus mobilis TaxID=415221 RepID=A0A934VR07_9BACT|nr:helix-turn-helix domain-containing protein [Pelagicoccus mobilis]MBK1877445.1 helix-turn-helix domain-containing protein [Pelagicoccus mobilis]
MDKNLPGKTEDLNSTFARIGVVAPEVLGLFDYLEDVPLWIKDVEGTYQWANVPFILNFGLKTREDVIGHNDFELCGETLANQYRIDDERVLKGEHIRSRLELVGRFDHTARWCVTSKVPLHDAAGQIVGNAGVTRPLENLATSRERNSPLSEAVRYVSEHYKEPITNSDLAKACNLSVRAFERRFRAAYGSTPHDYVRRLRIRMSCSSLVFSKNSIAEVASEFGYADQSHFAKEFRRAMGETPSEYRERYQ